MKWLLGSITRKDKNLYQVSFKSDDEPDVLHYRVFKFYVDNQVVPTVTWDTDFRKFSGLDLSPFSKLFDAILDLYSLEEIECP